MKKLNLQSNGILTKKFSNELSGYNASEVDTFLDKILEDYVAYEAEIISLEKTIAGKNSLVISREAAIEKLQLEIATLKDQLEKTGKASNAALLDELRELKKEIKSNKQ